MNKNSKKASTSRKRKNNARTSKRSCSSNSSSSKSDVDRMKYEIANEFGVSLGADTTSRDNGSVGGEITKRLVRSGMKNL